jgi:hypothetical protein
VSGRRFKLGAIFLMTGILVAGMERPISASLNNFVESYQAVSNTSAPMSFWERLVYSIALSKQRAPEKKCMAANLPART